MGGADDRPFPGSPGSGPVLLIVEDEVLIRASLCDHLMDCGYFVIEAGNAHEAIDIMKAGFDIDLVVTDVQMPGTIDGFGLAKWIRENRPELAVFVVSGYPGKVDLAKELCAGEQFFSKPYDLDLLTSRIDAHIVALKAPKH